MKGLLITRNFPPLLGGMERLNWHVADELARHGTVTVVAPEGSAARAPTGVVVHEVPGRPLWRFLLGALVSGIRQARGLRPDVVLAGSGLTAPLAWMTARLSGARAAVYVHGLDVVARHWLYRLLWIPFLRRMDRVIANSRATAALAEAAGVAPMRIEIIPPGVTLPEAITAEERETARRTFRQCHDLGDGPLLLSVGRLTTRKGMLEFVRDVFPEIVRQVPEAQLAIIGGEPAQALYAGVQSVEQIRSVAEKAGVAGKVRFLGEFTEWERLREAYLAADVHVFPVRSIPGDPEGFGMVAVEAAAHGLPTVAYATGGVVDAVADGVSGWLVPPGDTDAFAAAVVDNLEAPLSLLAMHAHAEQFARPNFGERLARALQGS
ncbi:glycosyltransferase family 4 protein [endosymbiont of unidentified scaly snail isolate Monju]|uniref:glycosyltransferase family 4 protein n=1 Tax=endosymbiont of unidentified scaly snail isolate Monju TaxID=1248727 RepID=UPI0003892457|nr:glycosyltransferase family 4 protein [endosymbiont of unidentified scaly snail isolate Monju]BAN69957.1 glycosyl transferase group 1 [endosymbiont of unidentified scaly snail isolate Monju]